MSEILTNNQNYYDIADTIRQMKNVNTTYKPREMASALKDIYSNEVEGVPPLSFESNGMPLIDFRIDGAIGGVGDRTNNLFSSDISDGYHLDSTTGLPVQSLTRCATVEPISINSNNLILTFKSNVVATKLMYSLFSGNTLMRRVANLSSGATIDATNANKIYFAFYRTDSSSAVLSSENLNEIMLSETLVDYEPYGYKVPVMVEGKNLLQNTATSQTINGVTFTVNSDGSVTCNGTANNTVMYEIHRFPRFNSGCILSGCPMTGSQNTYQLQYTNMSNMAYKEYGAGINIYQFDETQYPTSRINIRIENGYTCDNLTFYPMIRKADIEDDTYEPYIEPTTTNIYLDEPIGENESISLSDIEEEIETIEGTNTLTIDTTVQPSNVYIQSRKDPDEIVDLTTILEEEI